MLQRAAHALGRRFHVATGKGPQGEQGLGAGPLAGQEPFKRQGLRQRAVQGRQAHLAELFPQLVEPGIPEDRPPIEDQDVVDDLLDVAEDVG